MSKSIIGKLSILLISLLILSVLLEYLFRLALFSNSSAFQKFRNPGLYTNYFSEDDYWKLYYKFGGEFKPPENPHHALGWVGDFSKEDYSHNKTDQLKGRRPVLLYGDSYANCSEGDVICFQYLLNNDYTLNQENYLLNYGVGGYGLDQIFLLFKNSINKYKKPFVVFSFMVLDLDRSILSVRIGQKPYFVIEDNQLQHSKITIHKDPDEYYRKNPPKIKSYIYRKIVYSNLLPPNIKQILQRDKYYIDKKIAINTKILDKASKILSNNNYNHVFLVFHTHWPGVSSLDKLDWRDKFLLKYFKQHNLPLIWSRDIISKDTKLTGKVYADYIDPNTGHPTTYLNRLIYNEIKKFVLNN